MPKQKKASSKNRNPQISRNLIRQTSKRVYKAKMLFQLNAKPDSRITNKVLPDAVVENKNTKHTTIRPILRKLKK